MKTKIRFPSLGVLVAGLLPAVSAAAAEHPNIVYIMADDHGRQAISCYDSHLLQTPNLDRLAKDGVRFTEAFANNSICSPSRAVLLTGKYNHLCGVERLAGHFDGTQQTFPKLLQRAGYTTALLGKWHLWSRPTGFDHFVVVPLGAHVNPPMTDETIPWKGEYGGPLHKGYTTDLLTDLAIQWLDQQKDKPFCLMLHFTAPHSPHIPAPRHQHLFQDTVFPEPANLLDDYTGRAPALVAEALVWSRLVQNDYPQYQPLRKDYTGEIGHDTRLVYQEYVRGYLRMVAGIDENVGRLLDYLDLSGLTNNTVVIYTSDNGFFLGEHGFYNKMWMYEDGFHIPLIVRMPRPPATTTNSDIVSMVDMAPTILDLAGVSVPAEVQGRSLKPLILGQSPSPQWRESLYYHYYGYTASTSNNWIGSTNGEIFGIRTRTAKLVCYPRWRNGPFWESFDLVNDPLEMTNLYAAPSHQDELSGLRKQLYDLAGFYKDTNIVNVLDTLNK